MFMVVFNDQVLPRANHRLRTLKEDIARKKPTFALHAQVINEVSPGKLYLAANHWTPDPTGCTKSSSTIWATPRERTIYADSGTMAMVPETGDLVMTLYHGNIQEQQKAEPHRVATPLLRGRIRVKGVGDSLTRSTNDDYKSEREEWSDLRDPAPALTVAERGRRNDGSIPPVSIYRSALDETRGVGHGRDRQCPPVPANLPAIGGQPRLTQPDCQFATNTLGAGGYRDARASTFDRAPKERPVSFAMAARATARRAPHLPSPPTRASRARCRPDQARDPPAGPSPIRPGTRERGGSPPQLCAIPMGATASRVGTSPASALSVPQGGVLGRTASTRPLGDDADRMPVLARRLSAVWPPSLLRAKVPPRLGQPTFHTARRLIASI